MSNQSLPHKFIFARIAEGNAYFISKMFDISANGTANMHIKNPHTDKIMWLAGLDLRATGDTNFYMIDSFDSTTDGDTVTIQNALMDSEGGSPDSGPFEAYYNSSYTASNGNIPLGFTRGTAPKSKELEFYPSAVEPGREVVIEFDNQESTQRTGFIAILLITSY